MRVEEGVEGDEVVSAGDGVVLPLTVPDGLPAFDAVGCNEEPQPQSARARQSAPAAPHTPARRGPEPGEAR